MPTDAEGSPQPGSIFDSSMRTLMKIDPGAVCRLADVKAEGEVVDVPARFPLQAREADLLLRVGPHRLAHFEYQRRVEADLVVRMVGYRYLIMDKYPDDELTQYVVVLGSGRVRGHDDLPGRHFALDLQVVYVRDLDPAVLLADPVLAPLAALGHGSPAERQDALAAALRVIGASGLPGVTELREAALRLARITLERTTIWRIMSTSKIDHELEAEIKEDIEFFYRGVPVVQRIAAEMAGEVKASMLIVFLRDRFGDDPALPDIAVRLAAWSDQAAAVHAITSASSVADLRQRVGG